LSSLVIVSASPPLPDRCRVRMDGSSHAGAAERTRTAARRSVGYPDESPTRDSFGCAAVLFAE
jgi:hypothetical protein